MTKLNRHEEVRLSNLRRQMAELMQKDLSNDHAAWTQFQELQTHAHKWAGQNLARRQLRQGQLRTIKGMHAQLVEPRAPLRTKRIETLDHENADDRSCFRCGKTVKIGRGRWIHVVNGGGVVLHPDDEAKYVPDGGDLGGQLLGSDCAKRLGLDWSIPEAGSSLSAQDESIMRDNASGREP